MNGSYLDYMQVRELEHLGYQRQAPDPALQDWVQCLWHLISPISSPSLENLYPDGGASLIFDFSTNSKNPYYFSALQVVSNRQIAAHEELLGIRFLPGGAAALLGIDLAELDGNEIAADALHVPDVSRLYEQLLGLSAQERLRVAQQWLLQKAPLAPDSVLPRLYRRMCAHDEAVEQLILGSGLGRRKLERLFKQQVGLAPKQLSRLLRVRQARYLIKLNPDQALSEVALGAGFYDQSHFSRQFRRVTGATPGEYQRRQQEKLGRLSHRALW